MWGKEEKMGKIKIEIKNRWTGSVLFEYEKENNTVKDTMEEAIKGGANLEGAYLGGAYLGGAYLGGAYLEGAYLEGAYLEGAYLKGAYLGGAYLGGANLEGAYIYLDDDEIDIENVVKNFEEKNNIKITEWYVNRNVIPTRWNCFWKYGLIICNYEIGKIIKKITIEEAEKELSEKYGCEVKVG